MADTKESYKNLKSQLDDVLAQLQDESLDIDEAVILHEKGQKLIDQLEKYLDGTSAKIKKNTKE